MRDPRETIVRNVLLFPANGGAPAITPMTFSEAGSRSNPCGFYMVNVDLRGLYGEDNMYATRKEPWDITDDRSDGDAGGKYDLFHNVSPELPINVAMARLVDVDPEKPGKRPLWRGDVVVVKRDEWPTAVSRGLPMDYCDVSVQAMDVFGSHLIPEWYNSNEWRDFFQIERVKNDDWDDWPLTDDEKKIVEKTIRLFDGLIAAQAEHIKRLDLDNIVACGHCQVNESSLAQSLRVCGGCRNQKYCSTECQKLAWKEHKVVCKKTAGC
ncbi:hypothetical protein B0H19DRAFT_1380134 [Mycena capillaripes]|nr:hypothetical protein B0H19DRAFT_1380134 [Mycena capillaripes]